MRAVFLLLVFAFLAHAKPIEIAQRDFSQTGSCANQDIFEDKTGSLSTDDIAFGSGATPNYKPCTSGYTSSIFWSKLTVQNSSDKDISTVFRSPRAGLDEIDVFVYIDGKLHAKHTLGDKREQALRELKSPKSAFLLELPKNSQVMVVTRFASSGPMSFNWEILNTKEYSYKDRADVLIWGLFGGVILALIIYNLSLYVSLKERFYLYYVLHAFCLFWAQYALSGMFYFVDVGINLEFNTSSTWSISGLMLFWLLIFTISFFDIKNKSKWWYRLFVGVAMTQFLYFAIYLFAPLYPSIYFSTQYVLYYVYSVVILLFIFSIYGVKRRFNGAKYFLAGQGFYLLSIVFAVVMVTSPNQLSDAYLYILPLGNLVELVFLSFALSQKIKAIKDENLAKTMLLSTESSYIAIGRSIGNVIHQWKEPIGSLGSFFTYLEGLLYVGKKAKAIEELEEQLSDIKNTIDYMVGSVDELYSFLSDSGQGEEFRLREQIDLVLKIERDRFILGNISVNVVCGDDLILMGRKNSLTTVLLILLGNAIEALTHPKSAHPVINITVKKSSDNHVHIAVVDNGAGVDEEMTKELFAKKISSKKDSKNLGIGLPLAKMLANEKLGGDIYFEKNIPTGAKFVISLPLISMHKFQV